MKNQTLFLFLILFNNILIAQNQSLTLSHSNGSTADINQTCCALIEFSVTSTVAKLTKRTDLYKNGDKIQKLKNLLPDQLVYTFSPESGAGTYQVIIRRGFKFLFWFITLSRTKSNKITVNCSNWSAGWMDSNDKSFIADVNNDKQDDLVLINTNIGGGAILSIDLNSGKNINIVNHTGSRFNGWLDSNDKAFIANVNNDNREDLVLVNTNIGGGAILTVDLATGQTISNIPHDGSRFSGWLDSNDRAFIANVNNDNREDLVLVNTNIGGGAILTVDLATGQTISNIPHDGSRFSGWLDSNDRAFIANVNNDNREDLVLVNTNIGGGAILTIDLTTGQTISNIPHDGSRFSGWMDSNDRAFIANVNNDNREDLVLVNTNIGGGAILTVDLTTGQTISNIPHDGSRFSGWMDPNDRAFIAKVNSDNNEDLVLVNTNIGGGAILTVDLTTGQTISNILHDGSRFSGWMDPNDRAYIANTVNVNEGNEMVLINTNRECGSGAIVSLNLKSGSSIKLINH